MCALHGRIIICIDDILFLEVRTYQTLCHFWELENYLWHTLNKMEFYTDWTINFLDSFQGPCKYDSNSIHTRRRQPVVASSILCQTILMATGFHGTRICLPWEVKKPSRKLHSRWFMIPFSLIPLFIYLSLLSGINLSFHLVIRGTYLKCGRPANTYQVHCTDNQTWPNCGPWKIRKAPGTSVKY